VALENGVGKVVSGLHTLVVNTRRSNVPIDVPGPYIFSNRIELEIHVVMTGLCFFHKML
jgi:hypothetical protein